MEAQSEYLQREAERLGIVPSAVQEPKAIINISSQCGRIVIETHSPEALAPVRSACGLMAALRRVRGWVNGNLGT